MIMGGVDQPVDQPIHGGGWGRQPQRSSQLKGRLHTPPHDIEQSVMRECLVRGNLTLKLKNAVGV
jgi:hypothetical protein